MNSPVPKPKRFLIGQLARFGDCLYATTIARQIKKDFPNSHITWAIASYCKSILYLNPHVDQIWEIPIVDGDFYKKGWKIFEEEAISRLQNDEFDEIIFSQIPPLNWINYTGTIRKTILNSYKRQITVSVSPVLILSEDEINNVKDFAIKNKLEKYKHVILFECMPASGQVNMNIDIATNIASRIVNKNEDVIFILSTNESNFSDHPQIISAASLSLRENAELTHYCTMLLGCSSGITWIATSEWAKKIPMLQLFSKKPSIYAGVHHDFAINGLDNNHIIEIEDRNIDLIVEVIESILSKDFSEVKNIYHQNNLPQDRDFKKIVSQLIRQGYTFSDIISFAKRYKKISIENKAPLNINFTLFRLKLHFDQLFASLKRVIKK